MRLKVSLVVMLSLLTLVCPGQEERDRWVDSVFLTLNRQEKVAQLFMVATPANAAAEEDIIELVEDGIGGIYITHGGPLGHARFVNKLQRASDTKLLVGLSAEWGARQSLDSVGRLPKPMVVAALENDTIIRVWGKAIAGQLADLGVHVSMGPNADNEVFAGDYLRYFSDNADRAGRTASLLISALQENGIIAVATHLPRRWSTERVLTDSMIVLNLRQIDTTSLRSFQRLIRRGVAGISTDYLHFSIQGEEGIVPAAMSQVFISDVLRDRLQFKGLVFSDVQIIKRRLGKVRTGEAERFAFQTGADVIFRPQHPAAGIRKISREVRKNKVLAAQLDASVRKILAAKYDAGLTSYKPVNTDNLVRRLNNPEYENVVDVVSAGAITVLQNLDSILPIRTLENTSFVSLSIGAGIGNPFDHQLRKYAPFRSLSVRQVSDTSAITLLPGDLVVVGVFPHAGALAKQTRAWLMRIAANHRVVLAHFGNPSSLASFEDCKALIAGYTDKDRMPEAAAEVIFGALPARGALPVTVGTWSQGTGLKTSSLNRLAYGAPESVGVSSRTLARIRTIMEEAIATGATPGCHTLVAKNGKVIYEESAGWLTYEKKIPVSEETIYDLASVTKISATLQTVLFMQDHGLIDIDKKASVYLPELKTSNKADFTLKDILTHQAGLWPFLPFWVQTVRDSSELAQYYSSTYSADYPFPVSENLFASKIMKDSLWQWIIKARIRDKAPRTPYDYRYSDMGFYILQHLAEKLLNQPMEDFLAQNLYEPLGAYTTGYLPLVRFPSERIAPTEKDTVFRKSQLTGYVHDQGAAMHGGIAGHAGLFSTANDLAKVGQMWLQQGWYGGLRYYKPKTIEFFSSKQFSDSRRGLGWDKATPGDWTGPTARYASCRTFGHTGFTGTCIWIDPEFDLVFIFLSNRVMPDMNNNKLLSTNIRPRIQQVIYEAIFDYRAGPK